MAKKTKPTLESIKIEENENFLSVLLRIVEDAKEKIRFTSQEEFRNEVFAGDDFERYSIDKRDRGHKKKLRRLVEVLEKEVAAERQRELRIVQCKSEKDLKQIELQIMRERATAADDMMTLFGPGSKYVDYLGAIAEKSKRPNPNWGRMSPPPFGCEVVNPLSVLAPSTRKSYKMRKSYSCNKPKKNT